VGSKKWIFFPPGEEKKLKDNLGNLVYDVEQCDGEDIEKFEIIQNTGEVVFVPSGWHHQVKNLEDTISINCLAQAASNDMVETLTDGVICLKDMHKNVTYQIHKLFEKEIKKDFEKFKKLMEKKKPKKPKFPKEDPMREQMMSLISKRHCEIASNTEDEEEACMECFESTQPTESEQPSKSEYVKSLATCSAEHLSPHYDECTTMMEEMAVDPEKNSETMGKGIFLCYMRVVTKNLVEQCSDGMTETSPENLLNVMQCGSYTVFEWMQKNVRFPKLDKFSPEDYSIEEDEEDFYNELQ